jgi:hypothetical protein
MIPYLTGQAWVPRFIFTKGFLPVFGAIGCGAAEIARSGKNSHPQVAGDD